MSTTCTEPAANRGGPELPKAQATESKGEEEEINRGDENEENTEEVRNISREKVRAEKAPSKKRLTLAMLMLWSKCEDAGKREEAAEWLRSRGIEPNMYIAPYGANATSSTTRVSSSAVCAGSLSTIPEDECSDC